MDHKNTSMSGSIFTILPLPYQGQYTPYSHSLYTPTYHEFATMFPPVDSAWSSVEVFSNTTYIDSESETLNCNENMSKIKELWNGVQQ